MVLVWIKKGGVIVNEWLRRGEGFGERIVSEKGKEERTSLRKLTSSRKGRVQEK